MPTPPAIDLSSIPFRYPGEMPNEPWPLGRFGSRHDGTPLLPGAAPSEEQFMNDKKVWAEAAAKYLVRLQTWIDENKQHTDPLVKKAVVDETKNLSHFSEKIAPYLKPE